MGGVAQPLDSAGMFGMRPVREVQAGNVHTCTHQVGNHFLRIAGRTNRADNFRATYAFSRLFQCRARGGKSSFN